MFLNYNFIQTEMFLHKFLPSTIHNLLEETARLTVDQIESLKFSKGFFEDFTCGKMGFETFKINKELSAENPLLMLQESKKSIADFNYKNVIKFNNIKLKDLIKPISVLQEFNESVSLLTDDDPQQSLDFYCCKTFCKPYKYNGVDGALILIDLDGFKNETLNNIIFPYVPFFVFDTPKGLQLKSFIIQNGELVEEDFLTHILYQPFLTYFFATIAILKMNSMVDLEHTYYNSVALEEKKDHFIDFFEGYKDATTEEFFDVLIKKISNGLPKNNDFLNENLDSLKQWFLELKEFVETNDTNLDDPRIDVKIQGAYLTEMLFCLKSPRYNIIVEETHSKDMFLRKHEVSKLFLSGLLNKLEEIKPIFDCNNHDDNSELHDSSDTYLKLLEYDWRSIANELNVGFSDIYQGTTLFSSDIMKMSDDCYYTHLHSFIRPHVHDNIKGIIFNVGFDNIQSSYFDENNHKHIKEMNTLYFFGIHEGNYRLWAVDHKLKTYTEIVGSGQDSNINEKTSAQLCCIILYLNALNYDLVNDYYSLGKEVIITD